ncbi:MAG: arginine--tRNA ligase [Chloroflexota bacterium]
MSVNHQLGAEVKKALEAAQSAGTLPAFELPAVQIERPRDTTHGDYATAVALRLTKLAKMAPLKIAEAIVINLADADYLEEATVAPPGFINFRLKESWVQSVVDAILESGMAYGRISQGEGQKVQIECVSANPTGPIHIGRIRGGVMGDTLGRIMRAAGYEVILEYYYNDAGRQVTMLGESVQVRYLQLIGEAVELQKDHYQGEYIVEIAQMLKDEHGDGLKGAETKVFSDTAVETISQWQKDSLKSIGIIFDVYYREQSLYESGRVWEALEVLDERGFVYKEDGATWFKSTEFGDDQNRVLVKSTGEPTYRMPDIAYHWHKAQRGFDKVVDIFGPDHHATAPQVLMGVQALGYETAFVKTLLHQIVNFVKDGQPFKMSTRSGNFISLDDIVNEVGADAIRYFMISRSGNSHIEFDMNLAVEQSDKNPVFYIQNAHVRCAGIFRRWQEAGKNPDADKDANISLLTHPNELNFLRKAAELSELIELVVNTSEPHHIAFYAYDLAALFHPAYETCRVLHSDVPEPLQHARLKFYRAAQQVFARVLDLMGMSAPEKM